MPINTRIDGNPDSVRQAATWLRSSLQANVRDCGNQVYKARTHAESGWRGDASSGFRGRMTTAGQGVDVVDTDSGKVAQSFDDYADDLHTAQAGMRRAKEIAHGGGLTVNGDVIQDPGAAPTAPQALPQDGSATPEQTQAHNQAVQAGQDHQRKVQAFNHAKGEADRATGIVDRAKRVGKQLWNGIEEKKYLNAASFTNGVAGDLIGKHQSILKKEAARLTDEAKTANARYLRSPGGSPEAKFQEGQRFSKVMKAGELESKAASVGRRFGSKIPGIGVAISAAGVGYDISQGKPPGKAIFSGAAGTAAAIGAAAAVTPVGWAALAGVGAGVVVGMGADYAWDHWVPDGAKQKINDGLKAVGNTFADAGRSVGNFFGSIF